MATEVLIHNKYDAPFRVMTHSTDLFTNEAGLAMHLIERWGPVLAAPDGEDSAGRQKGRELTAEEVVTKACNIAEETFKQVRARGWVIALPSLAECQEIVKEKKKEPA